MIYHETYHGKELQTGSLSEPLLYGRLFSVCHAYILLTIFSETLAANSSDTEASAVAVRKICVGWFQNARDRSGGRSKRRLTCPKMPLVIIISKNFILYLPAGTEQREFANGKWNMIKCLQHFRNCYFSIQFYIHHLVVLPFLGKYVIRLRWWLKRG